MKTLIVVLSLLLSVGSIAQTDINKVDGQGLKQGVWKKAHEKTKHYKYIGQFKDDNPYGKFVYYYEDGSVQAVMHFSNSGKLARSKIYHLSGYLMGKGKYVNKAKDSTWVYYDDRGTISYQETYAKGKLNGQKVYFYEPKNKQLRVAKYEYYKDDVLHGEFKEFHENSKVKRTGKYVDGNLEGNVSHYYPNGKMKKMTRYKHAVKHGYWMFYDEKGKEVGTSLYWNGKLLKGVARTNKEAELKELRNK